MTFRNCSKTFLEIYLFIFVLASRLKQDASQSILIFNGKVKNKNWSPLTDRLHFNWFILDNNMYFVV